MTWLNQLEPKGLLQAFGEMPPDSFRLLGHEQILAFFHALSLAYHHGRQGKSPYSTSTIICTMG